LTKKSWHHLARGFLRSSRQFAASSFFFLKVFVFTSPAFVALPFVSVVPLFFTYSSSSFFGWILKNGYQVRSVKSAEDKNPVGRPTIIFYHKDEHIVRVGKL
jgi:hypothetical protein